MLPKPTDIVNEKAFQIKRFKGVFIERIGYLTLG